MRYFRKVIRIRAEDSPNVRLGLAEKAAGLEPSDETILPGVLTYGMYAKRRATWDIIRQTVGLDGLFYEGAEILLFPPEWLAKAGLPHLVELCRRMPAEAIGIDPAEGGDKTAMAAVNRWGLKDLVSRKTPNTDDIPREAKAFAIKHNVRPEKIAFDRGGGGKQHADRMRAEGWIGVRTVAFGEPVVLEPKRGMRLFPERVEGKEEQYAYKNRRAEMFGTLRQFLDPTGEVSGKVGPFAIPPEYTELFHQLSVIPLRYDPEGRLELPPKTKRDPDSKVVTLVDLIGHSPDESDALVLALHSMTSKPSRATAGAL